MHCEMPAQLARVAVLVVIAEVVVATAGEDKSEIMAQIATRSRGRSATVVDAALGGSLVRGPVVRRGDLDSWGPPHTSPSAKCFGRAWHDRVFAHISHNSVPRDGTATDVGSVATPRYACAGRNRHAP